MNAPLARRTALLCVPLTLAPPMVTLGQYGITLPEVLVLMAGAVLLFVQARLAPFMVIYLLLFIAGWLGSLYNSFAWGIPIGPNNLAFFYTYLALALCGYAVGRASTNDLREIATSRITVVVITFVGLFAAAYPFMSEGMRRLVMAPFINELFLSRLTSPRFPGIGLNGNVYSFMVYVLYCFALNLFLQRRASWIVPAAGFVIVLASAGRTMTALVVGATLVLLLSNARRWDLKRGRALLAAAFPSRLRVFTVAGAIVAIAIAAIIYGAQAREVFTLYARFQDMFGGGEYSGLATRTDVWSIGVARLKLSWVFGIPVDPGRMDADNPLYFYTPHNEFIQLWTTFGILALLAHLYLIGRMVIANWRAKVETPWYLLYGGMLVQMMVDSVFSGPRAIAFFFMIIGLNEKFLRERAPALRPATEPLRRMPQPA